MINMILNISKDILDNLDRLTEIINNELSNEEFLEFIQFSCDLAMPEEKRKYLEVKLKKETGISDFYFDKLKELLHNIINYISKYDLRKSEIEDIIQKIGLNLNDDKRNILVQSFLELKNSYRKLLFVKSLSIGLPRLIKVEWRYDFVRESNLVKKINYPQFLVRLILLKNDGELQSVEFIIDGSILDELEKELKEMKESIQI